MREEKLEYLKKKYESRLNPKNDETPGGMPGGVPGGRRDGRNGARQGMGGKPKNLKKTIGRLLSYIAHEKGKLFLVFFCVIAGTAANLAGSYMLRPIINGLTSENGSVAFLLKGVLVMLMIYLVGTLAQYMQQKIMIGISQNAIQKLRNELFQKMQKLPVRYYDTNNHGDLMSRFTNDVDAVGEMLNNTVVQMISGLISIIGTFSLMLYTNVWLTLITVVMIPLMLQAVKKIGSMSRKYYRAQQAALGTLNGYIEETVTGQKVVKVFCHEEEAIEEFNALNDELFDSAYQANMYSNMLGPANAQIGNVSYVIVAVVGGILAIGGFGGFTLGGLASFLTFNKSLNMPIMQVSQQLNFIVMAMAGAERVFGLLDEKPEDDEGYVTLVNAKEENGQIVETSERTGMWAWKHYHQADGTTSYVKLEGDVVFDDVDFAYEPGKTVLHNIKMFATPGQKIAFVGATGAGKTTITNLINRFYDIADGKIRYDGININKIKKDDLRHSLGIVLQDTHLFTGTVADNIRYGKLDATDEEVHAAAKLANADSFIHKLPNGYDTVLTGDGANLSQGQRQLLAIARAAIADPPVLILDEATSSIDTRTEKIVQDGMDKLMAGRTTFVIAHRLSTIRNSDCIMVLDQGRIIERGNHDELIAEGGKYYQLYTGKIVNA